jgi:hypothetical protein
MKKVLLVSLMLALIMALVLPTSVVAAKPAVFNAEGKIIYISDGDENSAETVLPSGQSGNWRVMDRVIKGVFTNGDSFTLVYSGVFDLMTQSGNFHGRMVTENGSQIFEINGKVAPLDATEFPIMKLSISGHWTCIQGGKGTGNIEAVIYFVPTLFGHVDYVIPDISIFSMTSKIK